MAYFGQFSTYSKVSQVQAVIIQNGHHNQQRPVNNLREHFLHFHCICNTLQSFFPDLNDPHPIWVYFDQFRTYSKASQVHAFIIQYGQDMQQRPVHHLREHFLFFHSIYNTLQCFFPHLNNSHPILAYFGQLPAYSKVSQVQAFIFQNWQEMQQRLVQRMKSSVIFVRLHRLIRWTGFDSDYCSFHA